MSECVPEHTFRTFSCSTHSCSSQIDDSHNSAHPDAVTYEFLGLLGSSGTVTRVSE